MAAIAIPEVMGHTSIAQTPVITGLYTMAGDRCSGLLVFRFDSRLFYANASLFVDRIQELIAGVPTPVRWLILDCSSIGDIDYSASINLAGLITGLHADHRVFALADVDPSLMVVLENYRTLASFDNAKVFATVSDAFDAFRAAPVEPVSSPADSGAQLPIMHIMSSC